MNLNLPAPLSPSRLRRGRLSSLAAGLVLTTAVLASAATAQTVTEGGGLAGPGATTGSEPALGGHIFRPPQIGNLNPPPPSGGGPGWIPPDAGFPGDGPGGDPDGGNDEPNSGPRSQTRPTTGARPNRLSDGAQVRGAPNRPSAATPIIELGDDRWEVWWEANKFDFIELRRVQDTPITGQGVQQESPEQREQRLAHVRQTLRDEILPLLRRLAASPDSQVRASVAVALGKLRDEAAIDLVRKLLADTSLIVRRAAMMSLGIMQSGRGSYLLMNIADDTSMGRDLIGKLSLSNDDRGTALIVAGLRGDRTAEHLVAEMLESRSQTHPEMLAMVCEAAGLMGGDRNIRSLIDVAFDEDQPEYVRSSATSALGRIGDPSVTPALVELLDGRLQPRRAAAAALGYVTHRGEERVIEKLGDILEDESDAPTRHFAAISLGRIGGDLARGRLLEAFEDPAANMRPWLALALGLNARNGPDSGIPDLLMQRMDGEANANTLGAYYIALGLTGSEQGLDRLHEAAQGAQLELASHAALALGLSGHSRAAAMLRGILASTESPFLIRQTALGLGILADSRSIPDLVELIRVTNNPLVASYSAVAIALMGDENAAGPLLSVLEREGTRGMTATFAVLAVGQLFDTDRRPALSRLAAGDNYLARVSAVDDLLGLGF